MVVASSEGHTIQRGRPRKVVGAPVQRRVWEQIRDIDGLNLSAALNFARNYPGPGEPGSWSEAINLEPNVHVTIQWRLVAGEDVNDASGLIQNVIDVMGRWLRRKPKVPPIWAYAREVSIRKGEHLHLIVHVPNRCLSAFTRMMETAVGPRFDPSNPDRPVVVKPIKPGDLHKADGVKSYLLKEADEALLGLGYVHRNHYKRATGGVIHGKRLKVSRAIDRAARLKAQQTAHEAREASRDRKVAARVPRPSTGRKSTPGLDLK